MLDEGKITTQPASDSNEHTLPTFVICEKIYFLFNLFFIFISVEQFILDASNLNCYNH